MSYTAFWTLVGSCLFVSWLIRTCYEEWEFHKNREQRASSHRTTFMRAPFWHYWSQGKGYFHVIAKTPAEALEVLMRESTFEKVTEAEQDYI